MTENLEAVYWIGVVFKYYKDKNESIVTNGGLFKSNILKMFVFKLGQL